MLPFSYELIKIYLKFEQIQLISAYFALFWPPLCHVTSVILSIQLEKRFWVLFAQTEQKSMKILKFYPVDLEKIKEKGNI